MSNLTILSTSVRAYENLFSLNDLHVSSGGKDKHKPTFFLRNDQTKELIAEIEKDSNDKAVKVIRGTQGGTYACEELVLAYAMWISPKFHLVVLRAFLEMHKQQCQPKQLALPDEQLPLSLRKKKYAKELTEEQWLRLASMWFALYNTIDLLKQIHQPLEMLGSRHGVTAYTHASEYQRTLGVMKRILEPLLAEFDVDPREEAHYHKALQTLRNYKPTGLGAIARI
ncbi:P22AR C-terminal domain-containing protein [Glaesserella sp.]|uniref:P22AR C-terminal domain-containing protein n=2 Tax=Glaesserella sp. TaxID=2094731 RepID=UPI0035A09D4F